MIEREGVLFDPDDLDEIETVAEIDQANDEYHETAHREWKERDCDGGVPT